MSDYDDLSDEPVMNAKERRKARREEKNLALAKAEAKAKELGAPPIKERTSVLGGRYPDSSEVQWNYYDPAGWVHDSEHFLFSEKYKQCSIRSKWYGIGVMINVRGLGWIHLEEVGENCAQCAFSSEWSLKELMGEVYISKDKKALVISDYIPSEYFKCEYSKRFHHKNSRRVVYQSESGYKAVSSYYVDGKTFSTCPECERISEGPGAATVRPDINRRCCPRCYEAHLNQNLVFAHNHSIFPEKIFTPRTKLIMEGGSPAKDEHGFPFHSGQRFCKSVADPAIRLFGVEAETEIWRKGAERDGLNRFKLARMVYDIMGRDFVVIKEDGTLTVNEHYSKRTGFAGFEIVSCPADIGVHRERWTRLLNPNFFDLKKNAYFRAWDEYDTCGFHVHVSRDSLTHFHIGRILTFINHRNNAKFVHKVAGRGSDRFCKYIPKEPGDPTHPACDVFYPTEKIINSDETDRRNRSRRVAVNVCNKNTIEFRIFRGTMHPRHIIRNIEFVDATCDFCNPGDRSIRDLEDYHNFIKYVDGNRKRWPLLAEWMANQKVIAIKAMNQKKANLEKLTLKPEESVEVHREAKKEPKKTKTLVFMATTDGSTQTIEADFEDENE